MKMKRNLILILVILMLLSMALAGCQSVQGDFTPLTAEQKANILEAYKIEFCGNDENYYQGKPLIWFDENGGKRDPNVYRYFGSYGDCIVMLRYGDGQNALFEPVTLPKKIPLSRVVEYPVDVDIVLYNTNPQYPNSGRYKKYAPISSMQGLELYDITWLTRGQLEQLTTDLENWLAVGNY